MKEKIILIVCIVLFGVLLVWASEAMSNPEINDLNNGDKLNTKDVLNNSDKLDNEALNNVESKIVHVNEKTFEDEVLKSDKIVLVDFYADWCMPCNMLAPTIEEIASENSNIKVVKVNVDEAQKLAIDYGASAIPLLVVIKDGIEVNRLVGLAPKEEILSVLDVK